MPFRPRKTNLQQNLFTIFLIISALGALIIWGPTHPISRLSLGALFSTIIWFRTQLASARWLALLVLWTGFAIFEMWGHFAH